MDGGQIYSKLNPHSKIRSRQNLKNYAWDTTLVTRHHFIRLSVRRLLIIDPNQHIPVRYECHKGVTSTRIMVTETSHKSLDTRRNGKAERAVCKWVSHYTNSMALLQFKVTARCPSCKVKHFKSPILSPHASFAIHREYHSEKTIRLWSHPTVDGGRGVLTPSFNKEAALRRGLATFFLLFVAPTLCLNSELKTNALFGEKHYRPYFSSTFGNWVRRFPTHSTSKSYISCIKNIPNKRCWLMRCRHFKSKNPKSCLWRKKYSKLSISGRSPEYRVYFFLQTSQSYQNHCYNTRT